LKLHSLSLGVFAPKTIGMVIEGRECEY